MKKTVYKKRATIEAPVTKSFLKEKLSKYPTKEDLKEALQASSTKIDLKTEIALFGIEVDEKLDKLDEKNKSYRNDIMTRIDKVLKELVEMREDNAASTLHFERNDEAMSIHDKRITALELAKN